MTLKGSKKAAPKLEENRKISDGDIELGLELNVNVTPTNNNNNASNNEADTDNGNEMLCRTCFDAIEESVSLCECNTVLCKPCFEGELYLTYTREQTAYCTVCRHDFDISFEPAGGRGFGCCAIMGRIRDSVERVDHERPLPQGLSRATIIGSFYLALAIGWLLVMTFMDLYCNTHRCNYFFADPLLQSVYFFFDVMTCIYPIILCVFCGERFSVLWVASYLSVFHVLRLVTAITRRYIMILAERYHSHAYHDMIDDTFFATDPALIVQYASSGGFLALVCIGALVAKLTPQRPNHVWVNGTGPFKLAPMQDEHDLEAQNELSDDDLVF